MGSSLCNKEVEIVARQGANRSDSHRYREDWQRGLAAMLGVFMQRIPHSGPWAPAMG